MPRPEARVVVPPLTAREAAAARVCRVCRLPLAAAPAGDYWYDDEALTVPPAAAAVTRGGAEYAHGACVAPRPGPAGGTEA